MTAQLKRTTLLWTRTHCLSDSSHVASSSSSAQLHYSTFSFKPPLSCLFLSLTSPSAVLLHSAAPVFFPVFPIISSVSHILPHSLNSVPSPPSPLQPPEDFMILFNDRWTALDSIFLMVRNLPISLSLCRVFFFVFTVYWLVVVGTEQVKPKASLPIENVCAAELGIWDMAWQIKGNKYSRKHKWATYRQSERCIKINILYWKPLGSSTFLDYKHCIYHCI